MEHNREHLVARLARPTVRAANWKSSFSILYRQVLDDNSACGSPPQAHISLVIDADLIGATGSILVM